MKLIAKSKAQGQTMEVSSIQNNSMSFVKIMASKGSSQ